MKTDEYDLLINSLANFYGTLPSRTFSEFKERGQRAVIEHFKGRPGFYDEKCHQ